MFTFYGKTWFIDIDTSNKEHPIYIYQDDHGEDLNGQYVDPMNPLTAVQRKAVKIYNQQ